MTKHQQIIQQRNIAKNRAVHNKLVKAATPHLERIFQNAELEHRQRLDAHVATLQQQYGTRRTLQACPTRAANQNNQSSNQRTAVTPSL
jgi:hypothetical protein